MSNDMRSLIGGLTGGVAGFVVGVVGGLAFFYVVFMVPKGDQSFRNMDQAGILGLYTGVLGAIIGAVIGGLVFRRRLRPVAIAVILGSAGTLWVLVKALT